MNLERQKADPAQGYQGYLTKLAHLQYREVALVNIANLLDAAQDGSGISLGADEHEPLTWESVED